MLVAVATGMEKESMEARIEASVMRGLRVSSCIYRHENDGDMLRCMIVC